MKRTATIALAILAALGGSSANAQDQAALASKFISDAQRWLNATGRPLIDDDEPLAFFQVTEAANAAEVQRQIGDKRIFNSVAADNALAAVLNDTGVDSVRLVATNLALLRGQLEGELSLCEGDYSYCRTITTYASRATDGGLEFAATLSADATEPPGQALFVEGKSGIIGQVALTEGAFTLRTIESNIVAITSRKADDTERRDRDPDDVDLGAPNRGAAGALDDVQDPLEQDTSECTNPAETVEIDIVVGVTRRATQQALDTKSLDVRHLLTFSEALANQSLQVSKINGALRISDVVDVDYRESGSFPKDIGALLAKDATLSGLLTARSRRRADIAILVVDDADERKCGQAAGIRVDSAQAFAVVNWKCLTDRFSFAHEIGHLMGAWHDPATLESQLGAGNHARPPYAHGYVAPGPRPFVTIMGYPSACSERCGRMWYWANPDLSYGGRAVGTRNKNFDACIWRRRLSTVAAFDGR